MARRRRAESAQRDARSKLSEHRLNALELAQEFGNVAGACRQRGLESDELLRMEAELSGTGVQRAQGPAADPQEPSADDPA